MPPVTVFTLRKFSKFVFDKRTDITGEDNQLTAKNNRWFHYPQRTGLSVTFYSQNRNSVNNGIIIMVYHKGEKLETATIEELFTRNVSFIAKYPALGFKQIEERGNTIKRFQLEFGGLNEFSDCCDFLRSKNLCLKLVEEESHNKNNDSNTDVLASQDNHRQSNSQRFSSQNSNPRLQRSRVDLNHQTSFDTSSENYSLENHSYDNHPFSQPIMQPQQQKGYDSPFSTQSTSPFLSQFQPQRVDNNSNFNCSSKDLGDNRETINKKTRTATSKNGASLTAKSTLLSQPPNKKTIQKKRSGKDKEKAWNSEDKAISRNKISQLLQDKNFVEELKRYDEVLNE